MHRHIPSKQSRLLAADLMASVSERQKQQLLLFVLDRLGQCMKAKYRCGNVVFVVVIGPTGTGKVLQSAGAGTESTSVKINAGVTESMYKGFVQLHLHGTARARGVSVVCVGVEQKRGASGVAVQKQKQKAASST